ncbi:MAG TPA: DCC1-like thiol-disulfide oxidoreductase family protein, partial [Terriglobales bacterium]|nr:DCC1-like thiol-disulfide oxidoreductase family protein [Terriglobales bacterium]
DQRQDLPDSVVVRNEAGGLYLRSDAVIYVLRTLGRAKLARALQMVPRGLRDLAYRFIAKIRYAVFGREKELCPLVPPGNRSRFLP